MTDALVVNLRRDRQPPPPEPQPPAWPYATLAMWECYRESLVGRSGAFAESELVLCDRELARIARCESEAAMPRRHHIVPPLVVRHPHGRPPRG